jgi:hypothetical protein
MYTAGPTLRSQSTNKKANYAPMDVKIQLLLYGKKKLQALENKILSTELGQKSN